MESQFKELYYQHHPRVLRVAYYIIKDATIAEDIAQEVFLKLWKKRNELSVLQSVEAYLVQMTRNEALNYLDKMKVEEKHAIQLQLINESGRNMEVDWEQFRKTLETAVSELSPQCRLIFSLSRFEGLTNEEIAEYLGISIRTVETQISKALKLLRTDLKHHFKGHMLALIFLGFLTI